MKHKTSMTLIASVISGIGLGMITANWTTRIGASLVWTAFLLTVFVYTEKD